MTARHENAALAGTIAKRLAVVISDDDAGILRRAQMTLRRWTELECGDGNDHASWSIERDETTDLPYFVTYPHNSAKVSRERIPDREKGALKRVADVCERNGLHFYHQTDPRGCALYVSREPLTDQNYTHGVACVA